jgi:hypothetical protein
MKLNWILIWRHALFLLVAVAAIIVGELGALDISLILCLVTLGLALVPIQGNDVIMASGVLREDDGRGLQ